MGEAITAFVIFLLVAGGVMISLNRRTRNKMKEVAIGDEVAEPVQKPRSLSKRQQRIVATLEPDKEIPSIDDLVAAEAADTGVNDIAGGDGLDTSLKLRVYWRDEVVRNGCTDGQLEFRIDDGVDPAAAETEDVRLVCVRNGVVQATPTPASEEEPAQSATDGAEPGEPAEIETDGNFEAGEPAEIETDGNFEAGLDVD